MEHNEPIRPVAYEQVGRHRQRGIEAVFIKDGDALFAGHAGDLASPKDLEIRRRHFDLLTGLEYSLPAFLHPFPARNHVPSGMYAPRGFIVQPELVHQLDGTGFQRAIEAGIRLFNLFVGFFIHSELSETTLAERRIQSHRSSLFKSLAVARRCEACIR